MSGLMKTILLWATLVVTANSNSATAQDYPSRPITVIVPTATGGLTDVLRRNIMQRLSQAWGQSIVIENRGGAGHNIGAAAVAKAPPDGYTLMAVEAGTFVANPFLYAKLPYDAERDFEPISGFASVPMALLAHPSVPARNVRELIALAKQKPRESAMALRALAAVFTSASCCSKH
jgi:tripartite-type tricarboxylate transporter receptor subunit TctC